jgi:hypothetical protein
MEWFDALSLEVENRMFNEKVDALVVAASTLQPCKDLLEGGKLEIIFRPPFLTMLNIGKFLMMMPKL